MLREAEEAAAVRIQAAARGFLARRAYGRVAAPSRPDMAGHVPLDEAGRPMLSSSAVTASAAPSGAVPGDAEERDFPWLVRAMWRPGDVVRAGAKTRIGRKCNVRLADTLLVDGDGRPSVWFFTSKEGQIIRKGSHNCTWDDYIARLTAWSVSSRGGRPQPKAQLAAVLRREAGGPAVAVTARALRQATDTGFLDGGITSVQAFVPSATENGPVYRVWHAADAAAARTSLSKVVYRTLVDGTVRATAMPCKEIALRREMDASVERIVKFVSQTTGERIVRANFAFVLDREQLPWFVHASAIRTLRVETREAAVRSPLPVLGSPNARRRTGGAASSPMASAGPTVQQCRGGYCKIDTERSVVDERGAVIEPVWDESALGRFQLERDVASDAGEGLMTTNKSCLLALRLQDEVHVSIHAAYEDSLRERDVSDAKRLRNPAYMSWFYTSVPVCATCHAIYHRIDRLRTERTEDTYSSPIIRRRGSDPGSPGSTPTPAPVLAPQSRSATSTPLAGVRRKQLPPVERSSPADGTRVRKVRDRTRPTKADKPRAVVDETIERAYRELWTKPHGTHVEKIAPVCGTNTFGYAENVYTKPVVVGLQRKLPRAKQNAFVMSKPEAEKYARRSFKTGPKPGMETLPVILSRDGSAGFTSGGRDVPRPGILGPAGKGKGAKPRVSAVTKIRDAVTSSKAEEAPPAVEESEEFVFDEISENEENEETAIVEAEEEEIVQAEEEEEIVQAEQVEDVRTSPDIVFEEVLLVETESADATPTITVEAEEDEFKTPRSVEMPAPPYVSAAEISESEISEGLLGVDKTAQNHSASAPALAKVATPTTPIMQVSRSESAIEPGSPDMIAKAARKLLSSPALAMNPAHLVGTRSRTLSSLSRTGLLSVHEDDDDHGDPNEAVRRLSVAQDRGSSDSESSEDPNLMTNAFISRNPSLDNLLLGSGTDDGTSGGEHGSDSTASILSSVNKKLGFDQVASLAISLKRNEGRARRNRLSRQQTLGALASGVAQSPAAEGVLRTSPRAGDSDSDGEARFSTIMRGLDESGSAPTLESSHSASDSPMHAHSATTSSANLSTLHGGQPSSIRKSTSQGSQLSQGVDMAAVARRLSDAAPVVSWPEDGEYDIPDDFSMEGGSTERMRSSSNTSSLAAPMQPVTRDGRADSNTLTIVPESGTGTPAAIDTPLKPSTPTHRLSVSAPDPAADGLLRQQTSPFLLSPALLAGSPALPADAQGQDAPPEAPFTILPGADEPTTLDEQLHLLKSEPDDVQPEQVERTLDLLCNWMHNDKEDKANARVIVNAGAIAVVAAVPHAYPYVSAVQVRASMLAVNFASLPEWDDDARELGDDELATLRDIVDTATEALRNLTTSSTVRRCSLLVLSRLSRFPAVRGHMYNRQTLQAVLAALRGAGVMDVVLAHYATQFLAEMFEGGSDVDDAIVGSARTLGAIDAVVQLLQVHYADEQIVEDSMRVLSELLDDPAVVLEAVPLIDFLLAVMEEHLPDTDVQIETLGILRALATAGGLAGRTAITESDAIAVVVDCMAEHKENREVVLHCINALRTMWTPPAARADPIPETALVEIRVAAVQSGLATCLLSVAAAHLGDASVVRLVLGTLVQFAGTPGLEEDLSASKPMRVFVAILKAHLDRSVVQALGLRFMRVQLQATPDVLATNFLKSGVLKPCIVALKEFMDRPVLCQDSLRAMYILALADTTGVASAVSRFSGILLTAMNRHAEVCEVQLPALQLMGLIVRNEAVRKAVLNHGGTALFRAAMLRFPDNAQVAEHAFAALVAPMTNVSAQQHGVRDGLVGEILGLVKRHASVQPVVIGGLRLLALLANVPGAFSADHVRAVSAIADDEAEPSDEFIVLVIELIGLALGNAGEPLDVDAMQLAVRVVNYMSEHAANADVGTAGMTCLASIESVHGQATDLSNVLAAVGDLPIAEVEMAVDGKHNAAPALALLTAGGRHFMDRQPGDFPRAMRAVHAAVLVHKNTPMGLRNLAMRAVLSLEAGIDKDSLDAWVQSTAEADTRGSMPVVVAMLSEMDESDEDAAGLEIAWRYTATMVAQLFPLLEQFVAGGGVELCMRVMRNHTAMADANAFVLQTLQAVAANAVYGVQIPVDFMLPLVLNVMRMHTREIGVQRGGCVLLATLVGNDGGVVKKIKANNGVDLISKAMSQYGSKEDAIRNAAMVVLSR